MFWNSSSAVHRVVVTKFSHVITKIFLKYFKMIDVSFIKDNRQYIFVTLIVMMVTRWVIKKVQNRPPGYVKCSHCSIHETRHALLRRDTDRWRFLLSVIFPISVHLEDPYTRLCTSWLKNMVMWCPFGLVTSTPSSYRITNISTRRWKRKVISSFYFHVDTRNKLTHTYM